MCYPILHYQQTTLFLTLYYLHIHNTHFFSFLSRLDETNQEDFNGVQQTLNIIENLVEIDAANAVLVCKQTHILKYLLSRCKNKAFDSNKLYASEILSILLQADEQIQVSFYFYF